MSVLGHNYLKHVYTETLYMIPEVAVSPKVIEVPVKNERIKHLGENKKNILFISALPKNEILSSTELNFLTKILQAVQLGIDDVAVVAWNDGLSLPELADEFQFKILIFLNIPPNLPTAFQLEKYNIYQGEGFQYLNADGLSEIENDVEKKKSLWKSLKVLFG